MEVSCNIEDLTLSAHVFIGPVKQIFLRKSVIIFLPISLNIDCVCSKELSHWDGSFEYPQHMFWLRNMKNNFPLHTLIWRPEIHWIWNSDRIRGLPPILSLFRNRFNKFNNTGARMLGYYIYHMTLKLLWHDIFGIKNSIICHIYAALLWTPLNNIMKYVKPVVVCWF